MSLRKYSLVKQRKIFLNCMNSWFSNFIIEEFRTDYIQNPSIQNIFMGTIAINGHPLPRLFEPIEINVQPDSNYNQKVFENDIFIYNLDEANLSEVEFVIRGLKNLKYEKEKILIIVSNVMTWAKTPLKTFTEEEKLNPNFNEEEVPEIKEEEVKKEEKVQIKEPVVVEEEKPKEEKKKEKPMKGKGKGKKGKKGKEKEKEKKDKKSKDKDKKKLGKKGKSKEKEMKEKIEKEKAEEEKKNIEMIQQEHELEKQKLLEEEMKQQLPKIKTYYYREDEYVKRIPNSRYSSYKMLENLALSNTNPMLNVYVICPGFIYGCGEDFFFDYFRKAWIGGIEYMPIIGEGMNFLPTIHILDLVQIIRRIIEKKPIINYIFACDKTKNPTMKNIIRSIAKGIGSIDIKNLTEFDIDDIDMPNFNELSIDIQIKSSKITEDEPKKESESIDDYNKRKFKWHCEKGIPENMDLLRQEFNLYRGIKPIRIIVSGPPSGGKTFIAKRIANRFKISHLTIPDIVTWAKNLKNILGEQTRKKMKEMDEKILIAQEEYDKRKNKKKTDPPFDPSPYRKFDSEFLGKIMKEKISTGECAGKGYVLDNYPKTYQDCLDTFAIGHKKRIKREKDINEEQKEKEKEKEKAKQKDKNKGKDKNKDKEKNEEKVEEDEYYEITEYEIVKELLPDSVIMINNYTEESLKNKLMQNPEYEEKQQEFDIRFNRRLNYFKENNEIISQENNNIKTLETFYKENGIQIHYVNETEFMKNQQLENIKILYYLERYGNIDNFSKLQDEEEIMPFKEQENLDENNEEKNLMENIETKNIKKEQKEKKEELNINITKIKERLIDEDFPKSNEEDEIEKEEREKEEREKEEKKKKIGIHSLNEMRTKQEMYENSIKSRLAELKDKEKILLEKKSEVMRRYLNDKIMPLLAKGILNICETIPDDPVEALANFILDNNYNFSKNVNDSDNSNDN